jgi:hypothetical protein
MAELADRLPGEVILSSFHNQVKERTMMRYATLAALEASVALPVYGGFAYLTEWPYPKTTGGTGFGGAGSAWIYAQDGDDTSPFTTEDRWQNLIRDSGGLMFGPLAFHGSELGSQNDPASQFFKIDCTDDWRFRLLQANDGESGVNVLNFSGDVGGTNYMRLPRGGTWGVRERTGSKEPFVVRDQTAIEFPYSADTDAAEPFYPLTFTNPNEWGPATGRIGIYALKTIGQPTLAISRLDATTERALAITAAPSSSSTNWRVGPVSYATPNGAEAYTLERQSGSSRRWKTAIAEYAGDAAAAILAALQVVSFEYEPGYLGEGDEREGVPMVGMIAEQLADVSPVLVDHDDAGEAVGYDTRQVQALLVAAVQDLGARIGALENAS